jgi:MoaA/NifB/PqqE/SkfB family radical SAM enzyme
MSKAQDLRLLSGIKHGREAFIGPRVIHIDLTNLCNNNCIGCWCRSPFLKDKEMPEWEKKISLSFETIKGIIDDAITLGGLRQIKLVGGGEPFMHPHLLEIIKYIKNKDEKIEIDINTNFTLVDKRVAQELIKLELDSLTVSIWAADAKTYCLTHPNKNENTFYQIKDVLKWLSHSKNGKPYVKIYNVIFNLNYLGIEEMIEFALEVGAEDIQFVPLDPIPQRTDSLLINEEQRRILLENLQKLNRSFNHFNYLYEQDGRQITITGFHDFMRRLRELDTNSGSYDREKVEKIPCYVGWLFARIMTTGDVVPCCKGHRLHLGNVYKKSFSDIWNSEEYEQFRFNAKNLPKTHPYFSRIGNEASSAIGCYNCDNLWQNEPMHREILSLNLSEKFFLRWLI